MAIPQRPFFRQSNVGPSSRGRPKGPIFAIGRRVRIASPHGRARGVALTDATGNVTVATLPDGAEAEILAWQPLGPGGMRYRIQPVGGTVEGWLSAAHLSLPAAPPPPPPPPPVAATAPPPQPARKPPAPSAKAKTASPVRAHASAGKAGVKKKARRA